MMKLEDLPVFFFDLQTTGAQPDSARILEVAWTFANVDYCESYLVEQPLDTPVPPHILKLTGIQQDELQGAKNLPWIFAQLEPKIQNHVAIIHFAQFEKKFLISAWKELGKSEFPILCTHEIAKRLFPNLPTRGLKGLAGYFGHFSGELKRGSSHVEATEVIWNHLVKELSCHNIFTYQELTEWLQTSSPKKRTKYEYPLAKEKRLQLPKEPGIYRYISQWGEVLYVGKATSLFDRVNSYYRGQKGRDGFKLEMLTQAYEVTTRTCKTPLEAALFETDEIKKYNPRYNINLKTGERAVYFFSRDFLSIAKEIDTLHTIGPFSSELSFDSLIKLATSLQKEAELLHPETFYQSLDAQLITEGFFLFCQRLGKDPSTFKSVRSSLTQGIILLRQNTEEEPLAPATEEEKEEETPLTPIDIANKFERHFKRAAKAYLRSRLHRKLMNADIQYSLSARDPYHFLQFRQGQLEGMEANTDPIATYDRISVLISELEKIKSKNGFVKIQTSKT